MTAAAATPIKAAEAPKPATTKFFSEVEPKQHDRPGARKFVDGDLWTNDAGVVRRWNGTAWQVIQAPAGMAVGDATKAAPVPAPKAAVAKK